MLWTISANSPTPERVAICRKSSLVWRASCSALRSCTGTSAPASAGTPAVGSGAFSGQRATAASRMVWFTEYRPRMSSSDGVRAKKPRFGTDMIKRSAASRVERSRTGVVLTPNSSASTPICKSCPRYQRLRQQPVLDALVDGTFCHGFLVALPRPFASKLKRNPSLQGEVCQCVHDLTLAARARSRGRSAFSGGDPRDGNGQSRDGIGPDH